MSETIHILITWADGSTTKGTSRADAGVSAEEVANESLELLLKDAVWLAFGSITHPNGEVQPGPLYELTVPDRIRSIRVWKDNPPEKDTP